MNPFVPRWKKRAVAIQPLKIEFESKECTKIFVEKILRREKERNLFQNSNGNVILDREKPGDFSIESMQGLFSLCAKSCNERGRKRAEGARAQM